MVQHDVYLFATAVYFDIWLNVFPNYNLIFLVPLGLTNTGIALNTCEGNL